MVNRVVFIRRILLGLIVYVRSTGKLVTGGTDNYRQAVEQYNNIFINPYVTEL